MEQRIILTKEDCYCGVEQFYQNVAVKSGLDTAYLEDASFNCTKILVTKPVMDEIFRYYREEKGASDFSIGALWVQFGPKANIPDDNFVAVIESGFISVTLPLF